MFPVGCYEPERYDSVEEMEATNPGSVGPAPRRRRTHPDARGREWRAYRLAGSDRPYATPNSTHLAS